MLSEKYTVSTKEISFFCQNWRKLFLIVFQNFRPSVEIRGVMLHHRPTVLLLATTLLQYNLEGKRRLEENTGGDNDNLEKESWLLKDGSFQ